ncbi:MAG: T9SS type A sorting domain-containing protein [Bacteroidales bacterium]
MNKILLIFVLFSLFSLSSTKAEAFSDKITILAESSEVFLNSKPELFPESDKDPFAEMVIVIEKNWGVRIQNFNGEVSVYNIAGILVKRTHCEGEVNISIENKGIYIVKFGSGQESKTVKIAI